MVLLFEYIAHLILAALCFGVFVGVINGAIEWAERRGLGWLSTTFLFGPGVVLFCLPYLF